MTEATLSKAGDVLVKKVEIINGQGFAMNVTNQVLDIQIYEDLFSPFITGNFHLLDSVDISSMFPLVGEERVNIELQTPGFLGAEFTFRQQFYIYKMTDRDHVANKNVFYTLHFISLEGIVEANKKLSRTFSGRYSEIAQTILGPTGFDTKKPTIVEETSNSTKFISNWWSPAQCMGYLLENAQTKSGNPNYFFFENHEGLIFASAESLYSAQPLGKFFDDEYVRTFLPDGTTTRDIGKDYSRLLNFYAPNFYDYIDRIQSGYYASNLTTYDLTTKKYNYKVYDAAVDPKTPRLNPLIPITNASVYRSNALRLNVSKYYGNFNGYTDVTDCDGIQRRISMLKQIESFKVQIQVFGRLDYTVGRTLDLEIYKNTPARASDTIDSLIDKVMSGRYLISSISHIVKRDGHICNMELIKDSILSLK